MTRRLSKPCGFLILMIATGCAQVGDLAGDLSLRQEIHESFDAQHQGLPNGKFARHYERGWKQGYYNTALGNNVLRPSVPASVYLDRRYQTPQGVTHLESWYSGYEHGSQVSQGISRAVTGQVFSPPSMPIATTTHQPAPLQPEAEEARVAAKPIKPEVDETTVAPLPDYDW